MWMFAEGGALDVVEDGSPEVVAESLLSLLSPAAFDELLWSPPSSLFASVRADEVASPAWGPAEDEESTMFISEVADCWCAGPEPSKAVAPVLARLCFFCCSLSEGERDLLRVDSTSGMVGRQVQRVFVLALVSQMYLDWIGFGPDGEEAWGGVRGACVWWSDVDGRKGM